MVLLPSPLRSVRIVRVELISFSEKPTLPRTEVVDLDGHHVFRRGRRGFALSPWLARAVLLICNFPQRESR